MFVAFGVGKHQRRTYRIWEEAQAPAAVFDVSSRKTWLEDEGNKKALCARLGVAEYYLYDPEQDYLTPALQGFRLEHGAYRAIEPDEDGGLTSDSLGLRIQLERGRIQPIDSRTGQRILRADEVRVLRLQAEAELEQAATRVDEAEAEIERLRGEVERLQDQLGS